MPLQSVAQRKGVGELVVGDFPIRHLRLDLEIGIGGQQSVIDHVAVIARDIRPGKAGSMMRKSECITAVRVFACAGEDSASAAESAKADKVTRTPGAACRSEI